jgi:peptidyl-prolyl cis-trans isomerase NIMA-interacting 1
MSRLLVLVPMLALACADLTKPAGASRSSPEPAAPTPAQTATAAPARPAPLAAPAAGAAAPARISASHILVAYQGAMRAQPNVKRSKAEAQKLAQTLLLRAKKNDDFAELARTNSDDPTAKARGGSLGTFDRQSMTKPFADAAFALRPGQVSEVVETEFGFHIIKRTE